MARIKKKQRHKNSNKEMTIAQSNISKSKYFSTTQDDKSDPISESDEWLDVKEDTEFVDEIKTRRKDEINTEGDVKIALNKGRITKKNKYLEKLKLAIKTLFRKIHRNSNLNLHIINIIMWLIHVDLLNKTIEMPLYKAYVLSFVDDTLKLIDFRKFDRVQLEKFILWFKEKLPYIDITCVDQFHPKLPYNGNIYLIIATLLRIQGLDTRLTVSIQPWNPKIDLVKSRERFSYKKRFNNIQPLVSQKDKIEDHSEIYEDSQESPLLKKRKRNPCKSMPSGHQEMLSIVNDCDPLNIVNNMGDKSTLDDDDENKHKNFGKKQFGVHGYDYWLEVYMESTKDWICIGGWDIRIDDPTYIENCATNPLQYVIGVDQYGGWKDLTFKYASDWLVHTRKLHIVDFWWKQFLDSNQGSAISIQTSLADKKVLKTLSKNAPIPTKLSDCKTHPNYVIERDLLKYQVFHPDPPPVVGYIKDTAVYSRKYLFTLQSKERWLIKEGREVVEGCESIKTVERRFSNKDGSIELFGKWQTRKIRPNLTADGKLPKNTFGNIELYKPWMLPKHCVHVPIPGVMRIAKKLNIEAAPAVVGWTYCSNAHPVVEGIIILETDEKLLLDEWKKYQIKKEQENIKKQEDQVKSQKVELLKQKKAKERAAAVFARDQSDNM